MGYENGNPNLPETYRETAFEDRIIAAARGTAQYSEIPGMEHHGNY